MRNVNRHSTKLAVLCNTAHSKKRLDVIWIIIILLMLFPPTKCVLEMKKISPVYFQQKFIRILKKVHFIWNTNTKDSILLGKQLTQPLCFYLLNTTFFQDISVTINYIKKIESYSELSLVSVIKLSWGQTREET